MKRLIPIIVVAIVLLAGLLFVINLQKTSQNPPDSLSDISPTQQIPLPSNPTLTSLKNCTTGDIRALISQEIAAGTVYATVTLTNTSNTPCQMQANNALAVKYDFGRENIQVTSTGAPTLTLHELEPNQSLTARVRFPNGPQCTRVNPVQITFTYNTREGEVTFQDQQEKKTFTLQACEDPREITTITISPFTIAE